MLGFSGIAQRLFGSSNDRKIKPYKGRVAEINDLEPRFAALSDDDLRGQTAAFKERLTKGETLEDLLPEVEGKTALQKNPHPRRSLAWAAWIVAKLGGWDGYPKSKPPGPITFRHGLEHFRSIAYGWALRNV